MNFGLATKAFIVDGGKLLSVKRRDDDVQQPGMWEIPGGRLNPGENPFDGLKREVKEETGLEVTVLAPLSVRHFTRADGQTITLIIFVCEPLSQKVMLSEEHSAFEWLDLNDYGKLGGFFHADVEVYKKRQGMTQ